MNASVFDRDLYMRAWRFAAERHNAQKYPGTELPYVVHVGAVAMEVIAALAVEPVADPDLAIVCALLHDTVEDTQLSPDELVREFGTAVGAGVLALSKDPALPKAERMADSLRRIQAQPREIAIVKLADRIANLGPPPAHWSAEKRDSYRDEARVILRELGAASAVLAERLRAKIERY